MNTKLLLLLALGSLNAGVFAAPQTFDFKDPKAVNTIELTLSIAGASPR
jgi:hypothetical protein